MRYNFNMFTREFEPNQTGDETGNITVVIGEVRKHDSVSKSTTLPTLSPLSTDLPLQTLSTLYEKLR